MFSKESKKTILLIIALIIIGILTFGVGTFLNYTFLKKTILDETAHYYVNDGEFLKISQPVKIADFSHLNNDDSDPDGGFFIVTVKQHKYLIYKNNLSHRFGITHYPDCECLAK